MIEGIPDGWEPVKFDYPIKGESFLNGLSEIILHIYDKPHPRKWLIIRKIEKPKQQKQYRPFANAAEFEPFRDRWMRESGCSHAYAKVVYYDNTSAYIDSEYDSWESHFRGYTFDDGTPFGIEVTE